MKRNEDTDKRGLVCSAKITYPLLLSLFLGGCSHYGGQFSYFDLTNDNKKLASRQAAEKFWASVRPQSTLSDAHYRLGLHYQQMGEHEKAIGEFTKALRNDRSYCKAYNGIAMTYDLQKRCEPAHASYQQAVNCAPGEAYVYNNYACSSLLCGDYGKGLELLQKAENLAGNDTRIKNNLKIARTIAIHESISDYFKLEEMPLLPTPNSGATPKSPLYGKEQTPPAPLCKIPANTVDAVSTDMSNKPTNDQPAQLASIAKVAAGTSSGHTESAQLEAADPNNLFALNGTNSAAAPAEISPGPITVAVEVSNGNGTTGMAKRSADFLRDHGFTVRSVTNAKHFRFEESTIYYKEEYLQAAKNLAAVIPGAQNLELVESMAKPSIGVRVLLGRDLVSMRFPDGYNGLADYRN